MELQLDDYGSIQPTSGPLGQLPPQMRVLYVTSHKRTGARLAQAFASDSASTVVLETANGATDGFVRMRDEVFDAALVSHDSHHLDALDLVQGVRASGSDLPLIVLGNAPNEQLDGQCFEVGADAYVCVHATSTRALIASVAQALHRTELVRENRRLLETQRQRLHQDESEASRLLAQQQTIVDGLISQRENSKGQLDEIRPCSSQLTQHYGELLRTYIVMGTGNLHEELSDLTQLLAESKMSAQEAMQMHLQVVNEELQNLGARSARHVMNRANLLILEILAKLAESYRDLAPPSGRTSGLSAVVRGENGVTWQKRFSASLA